MNERRWERWGAEAGIAFFVFGVIAIFTPGQPPDQNASGQEITAYIADHHDGLRLSMLFWCLATVSGLFFLGALRSRLSEAEGGRHELATVAMMGGLFTFLCGFVGGMLSGMASWREGIDLAPATVQAMWDGANLAQTFGNTGVAVMAGAIGAVVLATGLLPKWVGYFASAVGVLAVVSLVGIVSDSGPFAPMGAVPIAASGLSFVLVLIVAVEFLRHAEAPAPAGMAAHPA